MCTDMYNFCVSALKSEADSNVPGQYSFEAKNLVEWERWDNRGYRPSKDKAPIEVTINFFCHIKIEYIVLFLKSRRFKPKACVEVYANSGRYKDTLIGKFNDNCFHWIALSEKELFELDVKTNAPQYFFDTYAFTSNNFKCTKALKIKIVEGSLTRLNYLEVWGKPVSYDKTFQNVWSDMLSMYERQVSDRISRTINLNDYVDETPLVELPSDIYVPFEFLDQITFELMTSPVILPCGKIIDRTTCDMFMRYQERCPLRFSFDPFTGVQYDETTREYPKTATALKARLDEFLSLHASKIKYIPRRLVGISADKKVHVNTTSALVFPNKRKRKKALTETPATAVDVIADEKKPKLFPNVNFDTLLQPMIMRFTYLLGEGYSTKIRCSVCNIVNLQYMYVLICLHYICESCLKNPFKEQVECCICKCVSRALNIKRKKLY